MVDQNTESLIHISQIACQLPDESVARISAAGKRVNFKANQVIFNQGDLGESIFIVLAGRAKLTVREPGGGERFFDYLSVGEHVGECAVLSAREHRMTLTAVMDTELLEIPKANFNQLMQQVPGFAVNISRVLSFQMRREQVKNSYGSVERTICLFHLSPKSQALTTKLANALMATGELIRVITDEPEQVGHNASEAVEIIAYPRELPTEQRNGWVLEQLSRQSGHSGHTLISFSAADVRYANPALCQLMSQYDQVFWLAEPDQAQEASECYEGFIRCRPALAEDVHWCWLLDEDFKPEQIPPTPEKIIHRPFKLKWSASDTTSRLEKMSLSRLVRHIRKTRLGLALGGGAARGMAHIGVLQAFENEGFYFDVIAGTSAGALVGIPYSYGYEPCFLAESFSEKVRPGWLLRHLPKGKEWYLFKQFRFGKWDSLLRPYVSSAHMDQLLTPTYSVTADLITGQQVVRDRGDAVHAILESINLPYISLPIFRQGMALVDGGIINNVPSDILPEMGADIVIGVDIAAQINPTFAKNKPGMSIDEMRRASQLQTILRASEVTSYEITTVRTRAVDQLISVDTSAFDLVDFSRAIELAKVGREAAEAAMPQFKELVKNHEDQIGRTAAERFVCHTCIENAVMP